MRIWSGVETGEPHLFAAAVPMSGSGNPFAGSAQMSTRSMVESPSDGRSRSPTAFTPAALKQIYENLGPELAKVEAIAPSAIKPDFQTFIRAFTPYLNALKAANYDFTKINFASLTGLSAPDVKTASEHITAYFTQVCHITTTP